MPSSPSSHRLWLQGVLGSWDQYLVDRLAPVEEAPNRGPDDVLVPGFIYPSFTGGKDSWMSPQKWVMVQSLDSRMFGQAADEDMEENRWKVSAERARQVQTFPTGEDNHHDKLHNFRFKTHFPLSSPREWWDRVLVKATPIYVGVNTRILHLNSMPAGVIEALHDRGAPMTVAKL